MVIKQTRISLAVAYVVILSFGVGCSHFEKPNDCVEASDLSSCPPVKSRVLESVKLRRLPDYYEEAYLLPYIGDVARKGGGLCGRFGDNCFSSDPPLFAPIPRQTPGALRQGRALFRLVGPWDYEIEENCTRITVPDNFVTDFASIRGILRARYPVLNYVQAAIIHDWLYALGDPGDKDGRLIADALFYRALIEMGHSKRHAKELYAGVRVGGKDGYGLRSDLAFFHPETEKIITISKSSLKKLERESLYNGGYIYRGSEPHFVPPSFPAKSAFPMPVIAECGNVEIPKFLSFTG